MPNYGGLLSVMKQAGVEATNSNKPVNVCFGKVTSASPLQILVEQKITLGTAQLVLTRNVTDYEMRITGDTGQKTVKVHNALAAGEKVLLMRIQGGQKYVVVDRVV